jgi:hypothetical protein
VIWEPLETTPTTHISYTPVSLPDIFYFGHRRAVVQCAPDAPHELSNYDSRMHTYLQTLGREFRCEQGLSREIVPVVKYCLLPATCENRDIVAQKHSESIQDCSLQKALPPYNLCCSCS